MLTPPNVDRGVQGHLKKSPDTVKQDLPPQCGTSAPDENVRYFISVIGVALC
jgi:hypothetical protein